MTDSSSPRMWPRATAAVTVLRDTSSKCEFASLSLVVAFSVYFLFLIYVLKQHVQQKGIEKTADEMPDDPHCDEEIRFSGKFGFLGGFRPPFHPSEPDQAALQPQPCWPA